MLSKLNISTIDQWSGITLIPFILFLTIMLVLASPGLSQSTKKQIIEPQMDASQSIVSESKKGEEVTKVTKKSLYQKMIGNVKRLITFPKLSHSTDKQRTELSRSEERLYQKVKTVLEHQNHLESINKELSEKLALKDDIITSLEYNEQILWNQLEESETIYWDALRTRDLESKKAKKLNHQLTLKENIIKRLKDSEKNLKAQLEDNNKKFEMALVAIDPEYKPTEERVALIPESLFGYSPPTTHERSLKSKGYGARDSNAVWHTDAVVTNTTDEDHPWVSLVCTTCHDGITNLGNEVTIPPKFNESTKNIFWEENIDVSDYMISDNLRSSQDITNNYSKSNNLREDSISTLRTWISPPSDKIACNDREPGSVCAEDSKTDSWWNWFNQKISNLKTNVAEKVYSYL